MKSKFLLFALMAVVAVFATTTQSNAAEAQAEAERTVSIIRGRVLDTNKDVLAGAVVYIEDLKVGVVSDIEGYYILTDVAPGAHKLSVTYVGYNDFSADVNLKRGETLVQNIAMVEGIEMGAVEVTSVMQGQHRAINTQKNALQMVDVVSSDQAGKYPDSNIGDALKRISGINVQYDQGEARFGQVRGTPADMSSVTVNGNRVPSAEGETRAVQLDLIPTDMIQTIEVNKVVTPDMDADAIGGSINLITKNSPTKRVVNATLGTGYSMVSEKPSVNAGVTYGDRVNDKFGFMLAASYQYNPTGSDNTEFEWAEGENGDYVKTMEIRQYYLTRERQSYSASFDYQINPNHKIDFKALYNRRSDWENRYKTKVKFSDEEGTIKSVAIETKGGSEDVNYSRLELQQTLDFTLGGEHLFGKMMMDWGATYSQASELRPDERYISYAGGKGDIAEMDYSDKRQPVMVNGADVATLSDDYELDELSQQQQTIREHNYTGKVNFQYPLSQGDYATNLKFGAKFARKTKMVDVELTDYTDAAEGVAGFQDAAYAATSNIDRKGFFQGSAYNFGRRFVTREFLGDYNLNSLDGEVDYAESAGNYDATEDVTAAYVRVDQKLGRNLDLMVGVRMESTAVEYSGFQYDDDEGSLTKTDKTSSTDTKFLPSVMLKWDANRDLKLRASFTNTLARPKYSDLVNKIEIVQGDEEINLGNPNLKSSISYNYDLSADYYFESLGLVRAGVFAKSINDFIVDYASDEYAEHDTYSDYKVTKPVNGGNALMMGAEMSLSRDLSFIAPSLSCMGVSGTYTYTHSKITYFNIDGRNNETLPLPGSPEHTANASIYFQKWGLTARLSYNYASAFIDELAEDAYDDIYYDKVNYMDLNLNYTFKKNYSVYADATNLLNNPLRYYQGDSERTYQSEYYGVRFNLGFKANF